MQIYDPYTQKTYTLKTSKILRFLYNTIIGRIILKILTIPLFSKIFSYLTKTKISSIFIKKFIEKNHINMNDYPIKKYSSFNDFFTRQIIPNKRPFNSKNNILIAPSDAKLTIYKIDKNSTFRIKNSLYDINSLTNSKKLHDEYQNGYCFIFRLTVDDYHHYHFFDDGQIISNYKIKGVLHTVNPIVHQHIKVYSQNSREVSILKTTNFNQVVYIEIGALNVGKINNYPLTNFKKNQEKGYFSFGASTIILLFKKDTIIPDQEIIKRTKKNIETKVKLGTTIGLKK